ncbi:MAG: GntR family transcriptional regulator [Proteobacteria bacterium]|jgi:DNA-binding GntR family transcriptional regulator|uniref:GntR family transcriptional regulator n=1 Tax=Hyphomicrobiales TaxID=356 RepID=UPI00036E9C4B|nr:MULTISPECIES: GntR family transcriptional regulator [Phyllobacteriaceae]MCA0274432.1 GntR family transcriptional regulator [Pseudomonadota bacterium]MCX8570511.1 GntR family transcriptional regulator [Aminobacter sp. MET-1]
MNVEFLEPVSSRSTIQDGVYRQLRKALMSGHFDPGQTLTIAMLSDTFKTSHMPVREALRRLIAENALVVLTTGSAQVPTVSLAALDDLCLTRVALETLATKLATERSTPADRRTFRNLVEEHEAAANGRNLEDMLARNQELHFAIYECCGSPVITQFIQSLWLRFGPYMRMLSGHIEPVLVSGKYKPSSHHRDLIDAMDAGDGRAAAKAVKGDIETTQALLRRLCKEMVDKA